MALNIDMITSKWVKMNTGIDLLGYYLVFFLFILLILDKTKSRKDGVLSGPKT